MSHLPADLPADAPRQNDPVIEEEARQDKENAQLAAPALLKKWKDGPPVGKAYVWYWWHFWGRAEVWRMTLHFAQVTYEFCGFTNDEYDAMRPLLKREGLLDAVNGPLPCLQLDGLSVAETLGACRYIGQTRGLYVDPTNAQDVMRIETRLVGAQKLFQKLVEYHYQNYNLKGGKKQLSDALDRAEAGKSLSFVVSDLFAMVEETYLANGGGKFLVGDKLTIADLFVCHYRFVLGQPEFSALCQTFFEGPNAPRFRAYYSAHLAGPIGEYFKSRLGAAASPDAERIKAIVEKEVRLEHSSGIEFPFVW